MFDGDGRFSSYPQVAKPTAIGSGKYLLTPSQFIGEASHRRLLRSASDDGGGIY